MSEEKLEIVRAMYGSWEQGDFNAGAADLDPHVTFVVSPSFPEAGVYHGPTGSVTSSSLSTNWETLQVEAEQLEAVGDTVLARITAREGKASGIDTDVRSYMLFTFRGRRIVRIENVLNEAEALEAAGLSE